MTREPRSVLVVDDDRDILAVVADGLAFEGYRTVVALDAAEALRSIDEVHPWLVITDFQMPRMDGGELVVALRRQIPDLPAVIMSGNPHARQLVGWLRSAYLAKPFGLTELMAAIDQATQMPHETPPRDPSRAHREYAPA